MPDQTGCKLIAMGENDKSFEHKRGSSSGRQSKAVKAVCSGTETQSMLLGFKGPLKLHNLGAKLSIKQAMASVAF